MLSKYKRIQIFLNESKGGTLVFILMILMVVGILLAAIQAVFVGNLNQAKSQEEDVETYYLAYSGAEMAYAALINNSFELMNRLKNNTVSSYTENDIALGNGTIDVSAIKSTDSGFVDWIKITSIATMNDTGETYTRIMYFDPADVSKKVWKNN